MVRGAALPVVLAVLAAGCSSSHHSAKSSDTVIPTVATPTTLPGSDTGPSTTTKPGSRTTKPGGGTGGGGTTPTPTTGGSTPGGSTPGTTTPGSLTSTTSTSVTGPSTTRWKLALDYRTHPSLNPFPSYLGGVPVWSLREGATLARNGNYLLLPTYSATFGTPGVAAWHDSAGGCPNLPAIGVNTGAGAVHLCNAGVPAGAAFLEPNADHTAVVAWTSPFNGTIDISNDQIADLDGTCGDGVSYFVDVGTLQLVALRLTNNNAATLPPTRQRIAKGQSLYFIVDPGPGDNASCDTTQLEITVDRVS
jgi:hypothetical protein